MSQNKQAAGYNWDAGMSNNAVNAYGQGLKPLSKITNSDLKENNIELTLDQFKQAAKLQLIFPAEWHHTGKGFNQTNFYNLPEISEYLKQHPIDVSKLNETLQENQNEVRVRGEYAEWGGSLRKPKFMGWKAFIGTKKGNWIFLDNGGKKKADSKWIKFEPLQEKEAMSTYETWRVGQLEREAKKSADLLFFCDKNCKIENDTDKELIDKIVTNGIPASDDDKKMLEKRNFFSKEMLDTAVQVKGLGQYILVEMTPDKFFVFRTKDIKWWE